MAMQSLKPITPNEAVAQQSAQGASPAVERAVRFAIRDDEICVLTFDRPGSSANIFDLRTLDELAEELEFIERQTKIKGVIFISAKPSIFIAGADLNAMRQDMPFEDARALIERGQAVMNRVAALASPDGGGDSRRGRRRRLRNLPGVRLPHRLARPCHENRIARNANRAAAGMGRLDPVAAFDRIARRRWTSFWAAKPCRQNRRSNWEWWMICRPPNAWSSPPCVSSAGASHSARVIGSRTMRSRRR